MRTVLTIAGSDSIAGAGLQADLKTFAALGVYGVSAVTAVTAQNTEEVAHVFVLEPRAVRAQIDQITADVDIAAVKTGMLATSEIVHAVSDAALRFEWRNLVVDPVMAAGTADARTLLEAEAVSLLKTHLLPLTTVVTPNASEASILSGVAVNSLDDAREAAKRIAAFGPAAVVIKGGHVPGVNALDLLFHDGIFTEVSSPRGADASVHGTGCTFASAIAAGLALGDDIPAAVDRAKWYITGAIEHSFALGHGARILNHFWSSSSARPL
jgi:hydroxymethylpyrimidine/phosphomethylpyrimidine kinase